MLENIPMYSRDIQRYPLNNGYNPKYIVKLVNGYRCHEDIIRIPNHLFYNDDLIPSAREARDKICDNYIGRRYLPNPKFPLIWHNCEGENIRESNSPSWFNISEIEIVIDYCKILQ